MEPHHLTPTLEYGYNVVFETLEREYIATVPAFGNLIIFGSTLEEVRENATTLIIATLENYRAQGFGVPTPDKRGFGSTPNKVYFRFELNLFKNVRF